MTEQELEAISARASAATPAPWGIYVPEGESPRICNLILGEEIDCTLAYMADEAEGDNAQFIAGAPTDVPALVAALREANAKIIELERVVQCLIATACGTRRRRS